jgi:hypothetical protein
LWKAPDAVKKLSMCSKICAVSEFGLEESQNELLADIQQIITPGCPDLVAVAKTPGPNLPHFFPQAGDDF